MCSNELVNLCQGFERVYKGGDAQRLDEYLKQEIYLLGGVMLKAKARSVVCKQGKLSWLGRIAKQTNLNMIELESPKHVKLDQGLKRRRFQKKIGVKQ